ncbi:MAG: hypothetical protein K0S25_252 [Bacillus sp. (in: firmicutes)]|nr:hypothetical protein [Bacillus sp. (in: firmicutes)]
MFEVRVHLLLSTIWMNGNDWLIAQPVARFATKKLHARQAGKAESVDA